MALCNIQSDFSDLIILRQRQAERIRWFILSQAQFFGCPRLILVFLSILIFTENGKRQMSDFEIEFLHAELIRTAFPAGKGNGIKSIFI